MRTTTPTPIVRQTIINVLAGLQQGETFFKQFQKGGTEVYGPCWSAVRQTISKNYDYLFHTKPGFGRELFIKPSDVAKIDAEAVLKAICGDTEEPVQFTTTRTVEQIVEDEDEATAIPYTKQLSDIRSAMKLLRSGATNGIFLGGRGGVGKTQEVEAMLAEFGLEDGCGYFKIAGSASAAGVYRTLWENRNNIILFDDSDKALTDMEARNLFKAATDTKKVRKISWNKASKMYVSPEDLNMTEEGEVDDDRLPRHFEFTGKIIFISNLKLDQLDPDGALRTRGWVQNIDPTNEEVYEHMERICDKIVLDVSYKLSTEQRREVIDVLRTRKLPPKKANLRSLVSGLNFRAGIEEQGGGDDWKEIVFNYA